jgi:hypothetical protein
VRPRLLTLVRAQLSAVQQQAAELDLLRQQLEQVLDRLLNPRSADHTEGCRCLEIEDGAARERRRPAITVSSGG